MCMQRFGIEEYSCNKKEGSDLTFFLCFYFILLMLKPIIIFEVDELIVLKLFLYNVLSC